ncbi:MAG: hypothetical protein J5763_04845 [Bacteroidaceae bacterium]|nr:hypothetical protein [Bacteroidaceae bacterium]
MKRISLLLLIIVVFAACDNDKLTTDVKPNTFLPETEIFVQGQQLVADLSTKAYYKWPEAHLNEGWEAARFTIRADGKIQDFTNKNAGDYYGRSGSAKTARNRGKVSSLYPYGHYNDRDLDYYKRDKKTGDNIGWFRYAYDDKGLKTQLAILEAPSVDSILIDIKEDLTNDINNGKNVSANTKKLNQINGWLDKGADYLNSHVLWYVVKEVGMQYGWHVNGVITEQEVPDYRLDPAQKIPDNVEIDIHQQEHYDWDEIKTSIHIRNACDSITINLPLSYENIIEQDDFDIRIFEYYYTEDTVITHKVIHDENGITIKINNIPASMIARLKSLYGDGITVEIHSYCKNSDYWEELKNSCVVKTGKPCQINGQITSAFHPGEKVEISIKDPTNHSKI